MREEFFDEKGAHVTVHVLVVPKNGSNLLSEEMLKDVTEVLCFMFAMQLLN